MWGKDKIKIKIMMKKNHRIRLFVTGSSGSEKKNFIIKFYL